MSGNVAFRRPGHRQKTKTKGGPSGSPDTEMQTPNDDERRAATRQENNGPKVIEISTTEDLLNASQEERNEACTKLFMIGTEAIKRGYEVDISDPAKMVIRR